MKPCDPDIFHNGQMVAMINGPRSTTIDPWVIEIARITGQRVDWHMAGRRAVVLAIGDLPAVRRALADAKPALVAAYLAAPDNWSRDPKPDDVWLTLYGDGESWRDHVPHVTEGPNGELIMHEPVAAAPAARGRPASPRRPTRVPAARAQLARLHTLAATHGRTPEEALGDLERHYQER